MAMEITRQGNGVIISGFGDINLPLTLDCGQAFRWREIESGVWRGIQRGKAVSVSRIAEGLYFDGVSQGEAQECWTEYFDLKRDYAAVLSRFEQDEKLLSLVNAHGCIRILNQEPWETLCSFIISACNNISRIKLIIGRLCEAFGEPTDGEYAFPTAKRLAVLSREDLAVLKCGFRDKYILDAARKCASGEVELEKLRDTDMDSARRELMKIDGVGRKVADCTLLFSLGFFDAFPIDVHVGRAVAELYPQGLPEGTNGARGLAQQYIFLSDLKTGNG